jgi:Septum formation
VARSLPVVLVALAFVATGACSILKASDGATHTSTTAGPTTTTIPQGIPTPFSEILEGQCFDQLPSTAQQPFAALVIPCERLHTFEVYDQFTYTDDAGKKVPLSVVYPGENVVRTRSEALCYSAFQPWMGKEWTQSNYDIKSWWPSSDSWPQRDRRVLCAVYRYDGKRTKGSVRGTAK